jgi:hypothetical protein
MTAALPTAPRGRNQSVKTETASDQTRVPRGSTTRYVNLADLQIDPQAQREFNPGWVKARISLFDPDSLGTITVNKRSDGHIYVIDGQHRVELLRAVGWGDQSVFANYFDRLTQAQEAAQFLRLNDSRVVSVFSKFQPRVTSGEPIACDIQRIVNAAGFAVVKGYGVGQKWQLCCVASLEFVYRGGHINTKGGPTALAKTLKVIDAAWGSEAIHYTGVVIEGIGLVFLRYGSAVSIEDLAEKLIPIRGGAAGLIAKAGQSRDVRGGRLGYNAAGVVVDLYNKGRRAGKLDAWWS